MMHPGSNSPPPQQHQQHQQHQQQQLPPSQQQYHHYYEGTNRTGGIVAENVPNRTDTISTICAGCKRSGLNLLVCDDCASPDASGNKVKQRFCSQCMIGKKVRVFWPLDQKWYVGVVQEFNPNTGEHLLIYPDGDDEWVRIGDNQGIATEGGGNNSQAAPQHNEGGVTSPPSPIPRQQHPGMDDMFFNHGGAGGYPPGRQAGYDSAKKREREPSSSSIPAYDRSYTMAKLRASQQEHLSVAMSKNVSQGQGQGPVEQPNAPQPRPASPMERMLQPPPNRSGPVEGHHSPTFSSGGGSEWPPGIMRGMDGSSPSQQAPQPGPPSPKGAHPPNHPKSHRGPPPQDEAPHLGHPGYGMPPHGPPPHMHYQHHYPPPQGHPYPPFTGGRPPYNMYGPPPPQSSMMEEKEQDESHSNPNPTSTGKRKSGPKTWTKEEDTILLNMVQNMRMPMKWSIVAQSMPDRTGKQCRERYVNHLNPRLKNSEWSPQEDATIFHLYNSIGSQWAKMSKMIPGRTDNGIKNRFHNLRRQLEREDDHRLRLSKPQDFPEEIHLDRLKDIFPQDMQGKNHSLWDMFKGIGIIAAQSVIGAGVARNQGKFGPFKIPDPEVGELCARCGLFVPSIQTGGEICERTKWCITCTRIPPHLSGNLLRECLNLRKSQDPTSGKVVYTWHKHWKGELPDEELPQQQEANPNTAETKEEEANIAEKPNETQSYLTKTVLPPSKDALPSPKTNDNNETSNPDISTSAADLQILSDDATKSSKTEEPKFDMRNPPIKETEKVAMSEDKPMDMSPAPTEVKPVLDTTLLLDHPMQNDIKVTTEESKNEVSSVATADNPSTVPQSATEATD